MATRSEITLQAARTVFGDIATLKTVAQSYIESPLSRVEINYQVDLHQVPEMDLRDLALCAAHYVQDHSLHTAPSYPTIGAVRDRIAEHVFKSFPGLVRYPATRPSAAPAYSDELARGSRPVGDGWLAKLFQGIRQLWFRP